MNRDDRELWEERAAIAEFDGELPREAAERLAHEELAARRRVKVATGPDPRARWQPCRG